MDDTTITHLAHLARLHLPEEGKASVAHDVAAIIGFIDQVQKVSLDGGHDGFNVAGKAVNVFRDDIVAPIAPAHDLVEAAPLHKDHFVQVPKVLE